MLQALTTKIAFIFQGLADKISYTANLECFKITECAVDKAEVISNWFGVQSLANI